jgi:hypothetical protein
VSTLSQGVYNSLFPYYIEICAVTQFHRKGAKAGGWGGHATLFATHVCAWLRPGPIFRTQTPGPGSA